MPHRPRRNPNPNAVVTCEILVKLFQNYLALVDVRLYILFQHVKTCLKLFQNCFTHLLQLMNNF